MDDAELLDLIATAIVDGTDMDCTARDQAASVLRALRENGVFRAEWDAAIETAVAILQDDINNLLSWTNAEPAGSKDRHLLVAESRSQKRLMDAIRAIPYRAEAPK